MPRQTNSKPRAPRGPPPLRATVAGAGGVGLSRGEVRDEASQAEASHSWVNWVFLLLLQ